MTNIEQIILDYVQDGFPIVERPYAVLAEVLSLTEQQVFDIVENLRKVGIIRRLGGVYDSHKLGYISRLCCGIVPEKAGEDSIKLFADAVNDIPAITHNYVRSHHYNVWFTVIGRSVQQIENIVRELERKTFLSDTHILNVKKMYKINTVMQKKQVRRHVFNGVSSVDQASEQLRINEASLDAASLRSMSLQARVRSLAGDIPHTLTPFNDIFSSWVQQNTSTSENLDLCSWDEKSFLDDIRSDLSSGRMRRFGAILRHQLAGFAENAMVCFMIDESVMTIDEAGALVSEESFVSHCYERDSFGDFPYNIYAMVHAESAQDLSAKIDLLKKKLCNPECAVLRSERELKKTSFSFKN